MKKLRTQKGITLIALMVTVSVLLIIASVAISEMEDAGLIGRAHTAANRYTDVQEDENNMMDNYADWLESITISQAKKNDMYDKTTNSIVYDDFGNKFIIPAGFRMIVDDTTNNARNVTEGIVIQDKAGNQFVWIPVGRIYVNAEQTRTKNITLGRYRDFSSSIPAQTAENYMEEIDINSFVEKISTQNGASARSLKDFCERTLKNCGYYIGRFEASGSSTISVKKDVKPLTEITLENASAKAQGMYSSKTTFASDLMNSFAWDTAIIFIQTFGTKTNSISYASTVGKSSISTSVAQKTGTNQLLSTGTIDEQLNIYDMAGNCREWTTEVQNDGTDLTISVRGGSYNYGQPSTSSRSTLGRRITAYQGHTSFRPILYL